MAHGDLTLFDCPRVRRSEYWQFIKLIAPSSDASALPAGQTHWLSQDATDAFCLKCQKMFRFLKGSSNSVRRHMERFHKKELLKHQAQVETAAAKKSSNSSSSSGLGKNKAPKKAAKRFHSDQHEMSPSSPSEGKHSGDLISGAAASINKKVRSGSFGSFEQRNASELLIKWICRNMRPLSIVEDAGFVDFVEYISGGSIGGSQTHGYALPNRDALQHRLELMAENAKFEIKQRVKKEVSHFALSADIWQTASKEEAFIALSCHSLNEEFVMSTWTLEVVALGSARATDGGDSFTEKLNSVLRDWGLPKQSLALLFSDGDERIEKAGGMLGLRCFQDISASLERFSSHEAGLFSVSQDRAAEIDSDRLNILDSELSQGFGPTISGALNELKTLAEGFGAHPAATEKLQQIHTAGGGDYLKLAPYATESWTDVVEFLSRAVLWQASVDLFFDFAATPDGTTAFFNLGLTKPSAKTWYIAEALMLILYPFHELKEVVAAEKVCSLPFILPCLAMTKHQLSREDLLNELTTRYHSTMNYDGIDVINQLHAFRTFVLSEFLRRYESTCQELHWCSALDPRYGRLRHFSEEDRELCKLSLVEGAMELFVSQLPPAPSEPPLGSLTSDFDGDMMYGVGRAPVQGLMHRLLYDDDEDVPSSEALSRDAEIAQTRLYVTNEVSMYVSEHQLRKTRIPCPLQWWQTNRERYPFLSPLARIWLGTVTSCPPPSSLRHVIPLELYEEKKRETSTTATTSSSWQKTIADMIFLHTNLRSNRPETSISL